VTVDGEAALRIERSRISGTATVEAYRKHVAN
jgi:hypothetical protein